MSTQAQIDANRANSQKSTGPSSDAGKASSSQNRSSHRLTFGATFQVLPNESQEVFQNLFSNLLKQFRLENDMEGDILLRMAEHEWMRLRALQYQENILQDTGTFRMKQFALFMRYESQHERAYNACLNQLLKLRATATSNKIGFERKTRLNQQFEWQKQRHETAQKARQLDADCKIIRTIRMAANNPEAKRLADDVLTRHQAA